MSVPIPKTETKRLKILWQYDVLDTVPEAVFDDLTDLAAKICEAPIALISFVDEHRVWFKSKAGITLGECARDVSFCSHAIAQSDLLIVADATADARFADNPFVTADPNIRFYAGAPLITPDGHAVGTLCVLDVVPRKLRVEQKQALRILARHVVTQLELRRHASELASVRDEERRAKSDFKKVLAELATTRRELARHKAELRKFKFKGSRKSGK